MITFLVFQVFRRPLFVELAGRWWVFPVEFGGHHQPTLADDAAGPKVAAQSATKGSQRRKLRGTGKYFLLFTQEKPPEEFVMTSLQISFKNPGMLKRSKH